MTGEIRFDHLRGKRVVVEKGAWACSRFDRPWYRLLSPLIGTTSNIFHEWILQNDEEMRGIEIWLDMMVRAEYFSVVVYPPEKVHRYSKLEERMDSAMEER